MAAVVDSIISSILLKTGGWFIQTAVSKFRVRDRVERIKSDLKWMQTFLRDADQMEREGRGEVVETLVAAVRDAANEAEDAIEMFILTAQSNRRRAIISKITKRATDFAIFRDIDVKIENVKRKIDDFSQRRSVYAPPPTPEVERPKSCRRELQDHRANIAVAKGEDVIGFEFVADALVQKLTSGDAPRRVVSIVAMGGAGKTTLANKVYEDRRVKSHFRGCIAWTFVSQTWKAKEILLDIAKQVRYKPEQDLEPLNIKVLQDRLSEFLKKEKYLIVLDDVWKAKAWKELNGAFPDVRNGSRIMLTTRRMKVALRADSDPANRPCELPILTLTDSRNLLLKRASMCELSFPPKLENIGKQLIEKCSGLPIAITVIGDKLAASRGQMEGWKNVLGNLERCLSLCSKILALSYYDLPSHLKLCFLYLSLFPKEKKINAEKLKMIWVAEGFTQESEKQEKDDIAKDYLKELIDRSMIQVAERKWDGAVVTCRIHGLLHDLAISEARRHHFLGTYDEMSASLSKTVRRLSIDNEITNYPSYSTPKLRTFLCFARSMWKLKDVKLLRVLDLESVNAPENVLATVIEKFIYLKYLNLKCTSIENLPLSVDKHCNLETLLLHDRTRLPQAIWKMKQLRYLYTFAREFEGSPQFNCLEHLQTLHILAGSWIHNNNLSSLRELRKLHIRGDESSNLSVLWSSIEKLTKLQSLVLDKFSTKKLILSSLEHHSDLNEMILMVGLERLPRVQEFPPTLTKLNLQDSKLKEDPMPTLGKLMTLESLQLGRDSCREKRMISDGFPELRCLRLEWLTRLEEWLVVKGSMPKLESLHIRGCEDLIMLPESLQYITTLRELEVMQVSPNLFFRLRENEGEDWHKIKHITGRLIY